MHNELAISLQIEIADKSEDEIEQIASLSYLSLRGRRRNKRHGCFFGYTMSHEEVHDLDEYYRLVQQC